MKNNSIKILILCFTIPVWFLSCKEDISNELPSKTFRPVNFAIDNTFEDEVTLKWSPIADCVHQLEISRDSMVFEKDLQTVQLSGTSTYTFSGLYCGARYSVRIKAINNNPAIPESEWAYISVTTPTFTMPTQGIFVTGSLVLTTINGIVESVRVAWNPEKEYGVRLAITDGTNEVLSVPLEAADLKAGEKTINANGKLSLNVAYIILIYSKNGTPIGQLSFTPS
jgi:hypothetical protein